MASQAEDGKPQDGGQDKGHQPDDKQDTGGEKQDGGGGGADTEMKEEAEKAGIKPEALDDKEVREKLEKGQVDEKDGEGGEQDAAARLLQKRYRTYQKGREDKGLNLSTSARWADALKNNEMKQSSADAADGGKNDASSRWQRGGFYAGRLTEGGGAGANDDGGAEGQPEEEAEGIDGKEGHKGKQGEREHNSQVRQKKMETKYWLEMVDTKHRYASNLNAYHEYWNKNYDGDQNFFYWLDHGEGKELDLEDDCPRERLESERITYLSAEQRLNYLVRIDDHGRLVWARDRRRVDTSRGKHKDLGDGRGIVDATDEEVAEAKRKGEIPNESESSDSDSSISGDEAKKQAHAYGSAQARGDGGLVEKLKENFSLSPKRVTDRLLRSTLNQNTWIFVVDLKGNLYIGLKQTGKFQHSSFLFGSRVMAAGMIKVRNGQLTSLSPLSGHYRAGTAQFKAFVDRLEEAGTDMSRVSISKSLITIGALEKYGKLTKKKKNLKERLYKSFQHKRGKEVDDRSEQEKADDGLNDRVQNDRKKESQGRAHGSVSADAGMKERALLEREKRGAGPSALPHEGKKIEDMTYEERIERGASLIVRAMSKGIPKEGQSADEQKKKKSSDHGPIKEEKSSTGKNAISPDADKALQQAEEEADKKAAEAEQDKQKGEQGQGQGKQSQGQQEQGRGQKASEGQGAEKGQKQIQGDGQGQKEETNQSAQREEPKKEEAEEPKKEEAAGMKEESQ